VRVIGEKKKTINLFCKCIFFSIFKTAAINCINVYTFENKTKKKIQIACNYSILKSYNYQFGKPIILIIFQSGTMFAATELLILLKS
jgi:hypothetical protein